MESKQTLLVTDYLGESIIKPCTMCMHNMVLILHALNTMFMYNMGLDFTWLKYYVYV